MKILLFTSVLVALVFVGQAQSTLTEADIYQGQEWAFQNTMTTIAFGSCNHQDREQTMWSEVLAAKPDLWIWMGDNIYGDSEDMSVIREKYYRQKSNSDYQQLRKQAQVIGIWDDHDYGVNDGDKTYPKKDSTKMLMLDFLDVPRDAPVRERPGAYQSYSFGPEGKRVKVILLDARSFRDRLQKDVTGNKRYLPNPSGDMLGEAQWAWLEQELTATDAQLYLLVSGVQFIPEEHGYEKWANFPEARQRLFRLLETSRPGPTILLSGDRHIAEVSSLTLNGWRYPLYEITSSGMTHTWSTIGEEANKHRVSDLVIKKNFGLLRIDWTASTPDVTVEIRGLDDRIHWTDTWRYK